jgi:hypothetical protein
MAKTINFSATDVAEADVREIQRYLTALGLKSSMVDVGRYAIRYTAERLRDDRAKTADTNRP